MAFTIGGLLMAVLGGGTAVAPTGWGVNTLDPVSGKGATVDGTGALKVGDGAGALTVNGSVHATEAAPATFVRIFASASASCSDAYTVPSGKALILKSMQVFLH